VIAVKPGKAAGRSCQIMNNARLDAPASRRNLAPIRDVLVPYLDGRSGDVLEIGSGTGQHVAAFAAAFPAITWWPTDFDASNRESIDAWRRDAGVDNVRPATTLDASAADWRLGAADMAPAQGLIAIICINVVHISPWAVTEGLFAGALRHLDPAGFLYLYGPYMRDGKHTSDGNVRFDASLRAQNPAWGIRDTADIEALSARTGLTITETVEMPANNLSLFLTLNKDG
jgi:SAM-dependent methyltransferase